MSLCVDDDKVFVCYAFREGDNSDVEVFEDAPDSDDEKQPEETESTEQTDSTAPSTAEVTPKPSTTHDNKHYNPFKREPEFANADTTCLW